MGDITDGSSNAAQRAQALAQPKISIWQRLFGLAKPAPEAAIDAAETGELQNDLGHLQSLRIDEIAVPIADIVAIPEESTLKEVVEAFGSSTLTRLPVYRETLDEPLGLIHLKDLALRHGFGKGKSFNMAKILRPLIYAPPSMPLSVLLQKMQSEHIHMALVIDEYGGVDGLVTIEDLLEQIVGEIVDEHDEEEADLWIEEAPGVYLAQARAALKDIEEVAGVDLLPDDLDEDIDTLGGIVVMLAGRVPVQGEVICDAQGNEFEVIEADPRKIKRLRVSFSKAKAA
ncbi:MAG: CBS domain-containing protein [Rhodobacteraceae bacterium]|nr:CBS domain-containing protein [Paracoccaceae bacterium]